MENLVKWRYWWFALSGIVILPGLYFLLLHPLITTGRFELGLRTGIDFSGGTLWELQFVELGPDAVDTTAIADVFAESGFGNALVQRSDLADASGETAFVLVRTGELTDLDGDQDRVLANLSEEFGEVRREQVTSVGATISQQSTRSAVIAVVAASVVILLYLTWAFRLAPHPFRYGVCAIIAMLHDVILIIGVASILGTFVGLEVDALFLTATLTILSFSVHDTIVVFDRIRENVAFKRPSETFEDIVNISIVQTLPRSINTQLTTLFTLTALLLFGGATISDFVIILTIGLIAGTYSSIFTAAQLLVVWEHREWQTWFGRRAEPAPAHS
ncbi:MAG: protein translocase subunit SecF [Chloroflexaceae bacterium]|nr:protein translocase subunit SecF [Chloroflexaceae bacterium]